MEIHLGTPVYSSDGEYIGKVDRVVIDPKLVSVIEFIVHRGYFLTQDRIIEREFVDHVAEDGTVHLNVSAAIADQLPLVAERRYILPSHGDLRDSPYLEAARVYSAGAILWRSDYEGTGYPQPARLLMEPAPAEPPYIEVQTNLPSGAVTINRGTDVLSMDNHKIGTVNEVIYKDGHITGIVVEAGFLAHRYIHIPTSWITSVDHDHVRLSLTAKDVERETAEATGSGS
jgi:uncharacterized protein YrrD